MDLNKEEGYHLIFELSDDGEFPEKNKADDEEMEIVAFKAPGENVDNANFSHFLFDCGIFADIEEDEEADKEKFILFPDQNIQFF